MERVDQEISPDEFWNKLISPLKPCLIGAWLTESWQARKLWIKNEQINHDYLLEKYGYFKVPVTDFKDQDSLGRIAEETIRFVEDIPKNTLPGPQEGYIQVNFISSAGEMQSLWFRLADGRSAIGDGLEGAALYEYLMDL